MWYGAHDADRTRDLVLTKDVLYQLSYVGHVVVMLHLGTVSMIVGIHSGIRSPCINRSGTTLERAVGVEPTTASLEGWDSTAELRPPVSVGCY
jgi:hypothetical protein